jgi:hypothetical protein
VKLALACENVSSLSLVSARLRLPNDLEELGVGSNGWLWKRKEA